MGDGTHVALWRAVNLGGHNRLPMAELRALAETLGLTGARTLLASGNLVFASQGRSDDALAATLARAVAAELGVDTDVFVRGAAEWAQLVADNPFPAEAEAEPSRLVAVVLDGAPDQDAVAALRDSITGGERIEARGRVAYVYYPDGLGKSRLSGAVLDKKLGRCGTARNWNTVVKLAALLAGPSRRPPG
jgi:uncharacterized protein (DUF1697 family)